MANFISFEIEKTTVHLHHSKALFLPFSKTLVISDLHIGKSEHFRKNGILIPKMTNQNNFWKLVEVIEFFAPESILFLGDIAHSEHNVEWDEFVDVMDQFPELEKSLVLGNHDILHQSMYHQAKITTRKELELEGLLWMHEPPEKNEERYCIAGHIHPSIRMSGKGRQALRLPCFYFGEKTGIMPAFGEFTGTFTIRPKKKDHIFVVTENKVIKVQ